MGVYVYCLREDFQYQSSIVGREFENEWFCLRADGLVIVKGTHYKGYAWDGCSPKIKIKDVYLGTLEGVLHFSSGKSKTYVASLIHDVFYQFSKDVGSFVSRKEVDREFFVALTRHEFAFARWYYCGVRLFGWLFWRIRKNV
ncbi:MAG: hypothetical protein KBA46_03555 [Candidatus Omnitrophica bacterium]|nr:hypothetical protein [Candidatus Omnitrophota bacterium]